MILVRGLTLENSSSTEEKKNENQQSKWFKDVLFVLCCQVSVEIF